MPRRRTRWAFARARSAPGSAAPGNGCATPSARVTTTHPTPEVPMDELDLIRTTLLAPEPAAETVEAGRRRLGQLVHGQNGPAVSRSRPRWLVPGLGLTAVVAAATAGGGGGGGAR